MTPQKELYAYAYAWVTRQRELNAYAFDKWHDIEEMFNGQKEIK